MARGKAFVEVLDEVLGSEPATPARGRSAPGGFATPSIYFFDTRLNARPDAAAWRPPTPSEAAPPPPPPPSPRPRRALSPRHREALEAFVDLGARIDDDFTAAELRSVFRSLALRYHPDRHPGSSDGERTHLSACFAQLHDAYEALKSIPVSLH